MVDRPRSVDGRRHEARLSPCLKVLWRFAKAANTEGRCGALATHVSHGSSLPTESTGATSPALACGSLAIEAGATPQRVLPRGISVGVRGMALAFGAAATAPAVSGCAPSRRNRHGPLRNHQ